ncbi:hypothetical protein BD779DRAFT_1786355 [Infundibulicybe gibba]|nr:hypothetical protein BD779DRAFT_1786355 [Infundibulicybe gibba]
MDSILGQVVLMSEPGWVTGDQPRGIGCSKLACAFFEAVGVDVANQLWGLYEIHIRVFERGQPEGRCNRPYMVESAREFPTLSRVTATLFLLEGEVEWIGQEVAVSSYCSRIFPRCGRRTGLCSISMGVSVRILRSRRTHWKSTPLSHFFIAFDPSQRLRVTECATWDFGSEKPICCNWPIENFIPPCCHFGTMEAGEGEPRAIQS